MSHRFRFKFFLWMLTFGWAAVIFYSSVAYIPSDFPSIAHLDKVIHFLEYGLLGWLFFKAIKTTAVNLSPARAFLAVIGIGFLYGAGIECYQHTLDHRGFSFFDMGANLLGLITGSAICKRAN